MPQADKQSPVDKYIRMAMTLAKQGDYIRAEQLYQKILKTSPDNPAVWYHLASLQLKMALFRPAEKSFRRLLTYPSQRPNAFDGLAMIKFIQGNPLAAAKLWRQCLSLSNRNINALNGLALTLVQVENYELANSCLLISYDINPKNTKTLNNLALSYALLQDVRRAQYYLQSSLSLKAQPRIRNNLQLLQEYSKPYQHKKLVYLLLKPFPAIKNEITPEQKVELLKNNKSWCSISKAKL